MSRSSHSTSGQTDRKADLMMQRQSPWSRTLARYADPKLDLTLHGQSAPLRAKSNGKPHQTVAMPGSNFEVAFVGSYQPSWRQCESGQTTPRLRGKPSTDAATKLVHVNTLELDVSGDSDTLRKRWRSRYDPDGGDGSSSDTHRYANGFSSHNSRILTTEAASGEDAMSDLFGEHGHRECVRVPHERSDTESTVKQPDGLFGFTDTDASSSLVSMTGSVDVTTTNHQLSLDRMLSARHGVNGRCRQTYDHGHLYPMAEQINDEFVPRTPVVEVTRSVKNHDTDDDAGYMNR